MTDKEKSIVMAYTGITMLMGDKFDIFHKYVEEIMHRPVFTHELAILAEEIKENAKPDFLKLCAEEEQQKPHMRWDISEVRCPDCLEYFDTDCYTEEELNRCPNCGACMR